MSREWRSVRRSRLLVSCILVVFLLVIPAVVYASKLSDFTSAKINWKQCKGETIYLLLNKHLYTNSLIAQIPVFEKLTGIHVKYLVLPEQQFFERQQIVLANRSSEFDITMTGPYFEWKFAPAKYIQPLDSFINDPSLTDKKFYDLKDFYPNLIKANSVGGKIYAIPVMVETYILQYRKDLFKKYHIKVPTTMEELYAAAKKLKEGLKKDNVKGIYPFGVRGVKGFGTLVTGYYTEFCSYGGKDFVNGKCAIASKKGIYITNLWIKTIKKFGPPDWPTYDWYDVKDAMASGKIAMTIDCDFFAAEYADPTHSSVVGKVDYALPPHGPAGQMSNIWTWALAMNAASKHKKAAWLFLEWATSKPVLRYASVVYNNYDPTRRSVWNDPKVVEKTSKWGDWRKVVDQNLSKYARILFTYNPNIFTVGELWVEKLQSIWNGESAKNALTSLCRMLTIRRLLPPKH